SSSALRCFAKDGPLACYARYVAHICEPSESDAKSLGTAFHKAMENREAFDSSYVVMPEVIKDESIAEDVNEELYDSGSKAARCNVGDKINLKFPSHRKFVDRFKLHWESQGKEILTYEAADRVRRMVDSV